MTRFSDESMPHLSGSLPEPARDTHLAGFAHMVQLVRHLLPSGLAKPLYRTSPADKALVGHNTVAAMSTNNHLPTLCTLRRLIRRGVLQLLKIVLVGGHLHIVLRVEALTARLAALPDPRMTLMVVIATYRVVIVIAPTAIARIRKHHILVTIITYPVVTTLCFGEFPAFATQTTTRLRYRFLCSVCHLLSFFHCRRAEQTTTSLLSSHTQPFFIIPLRNLCGQSSPLHEKTRTSLSPVAHQH